MANLLTVGFSTTKDNFEKAVAMFKAEWKNFADNGFSKDDVEFAKDYLSASYNLRFASILGIADILVMQQKFDLGLDFLQKRNSYVKNITLEDVNRVANKYFTDKIDKLCYIDGKSDWIDLRAADTVKLKQGEFKLIPDRKSVV